VDAADFQTFLTQAEDLRSWGQVWRPARAKSEPLLPQIVGAPLGLTWAQIAYAFDPKIVASALSSSRGGDSQAFGSAAKMRLNSIHFLKPRHRLLAWLEEERPLDAKATLAILPESALGQ